MIENKKEYEICIKEASNKFDMEGKHSQKEWNAFATSFQKCWEQLTKSEKSRTIFESKFKIVKFYETKLDAEYDRKKRRKNISRKRIGILFEKSRRSILEIGNEE